MLERRFKLPDKPSILVHPNTIAKSGKFDCTMMSLSVLLDYRQEDNKEHSFEVGMVTYYIHTSHIIYTHHKDKHTQRPTHTKTNTQCTQRDENRQ